MAPVGPAPEVAGFREALGRHLLAIENRDIDALAATISKGPIVLITAEGRLVRSPSEFLQMHRDWFAMKDWKLTPKPLEFFENEDLGVAVMHLVYEEPGKRQESWLTLVFRRFGGEWRMVQDQNTPAK
ncbi:MAG TPA: nuclear transport factor 2 family protein [Burkholderiales bacterium]|nr:nuclear transport factor 2 family protein [Burkholderiales bacterium]